MGKVHGSLARAGKVRGQTPKVAKQDKRKKPRGRAHKRMQHNRRFVTAVDYVNSATGLAGSFLAYTDSSWILSVSIYVNHEQPMIWSNVFMMLGSNGISFLINKGMEAEVTGSILYALINCK
ncbi:40S ribosomal protein S30 [Morella rubra]|uniref:40S ribosomal protein S30 n=1 Tax=Morella rubra TaxID=262757 RepID=A0A6A1VZS0_9ROSI|nr:40S ribosomal protein S30 [Morella rubra]